MKTLVAVFLGLALALSTNVAAAYVVVVGAAVPIAPAVAEDSSRLSDAARSAIRDVLAHAVAFTHRRHNTERKSRRRSALHTPLHRQRRWGGDHRSAVHER
jgi:hypothetical protein